MARCRATLLMPPRDSRALHLMRAWASEQRLVLGRLAVDDKSNEIPAVRQLPASLDPRGALVTADAAHRQRETAAQIRHDCMLRLAENDPDWSDVYAFGPDLRTLIRIERTRQFAAKTTQETAYYIRDRCESARFLRRVDVVAPRGNAGRPLRSTWRPWAKAQRIWRAFRRRASCRRSASQYLSEVPGIAQPEAVFAAVQTAPAGSPPYG